MDVVRIALVDDEQPGQAVLLGLVEHAAGVDFDAVDGGDDDGGGLDGIQRFEGGADEVGIAGGIEQVDELVLVFEMQDGGVDREVVLVFFVVVVGDAGAVVHVAHAVDRVGHVEQGIGQRGLAARTMPDKGNGADVAFVILEHANTSIVGERRGFAEASECQARRRPHEPDGARGRPGIVFTGIRDCTGHGVTPSKSIQVKLIREPPTGRSVLRNAPDR